MTQMDLDETEEAYGRKELIRGKLEPIASKLEFCLRTWQRRGYMGDEEVREIVGFRDQERKYAYVSSLLRNRGFYLDDFNLIWMPLENIEN